MVFFEKLAGAGRALRNEGGLFARTWLGRGRGTDVHAHFAKSLLSGRSRRLGRSSLRANRLDSSGIFILYRGIARERSFRLDSLVFALSPD